MTTGEVIALAAIGGVVLLVYKRKQSKPAQPAANPCDATCTGLGDPGGHGVCVAACTAGGGALDALIKQFHDDSADAQKKRTAILDQNDKANGDRDDSVQVMGSLAAVQNSFGATNDGNRPALRYRNGCIPYRNAFGWDDKCKPGTVDQWGQQGYDPDVVGAGEVDVWPASPDPNAPTWPHGQTAVKEWTGSLVMSGSFDPSNPDPVTWGPDAPAADGSRRWGVAGQMIECPKGMRPRLDPDGKHFADGLDPNADYTHNCEYPPGTVVSVTSCPPPAGVTWDPKIGNWRAMRAGETQNLGSCGGQTATQGAVVASSGTTTVFGGLLPGHPR